MLIYIMLPLCSESTILLKQIFSNQASYSSGLMPELIPVPWEYQTWTLNKGHVTCLEWAVLMLSWQAGSISSI